MLSHVGYFSCLLWSPARCNITEKRLLCSIICLFLFFPEQFIRTRPTLISFLEALPHNSFIGNTKKCLKRTAYRPIVYCYTAWSAIGIIGLLSSVRLSVHLYRWALWRVINQSITFNEHVTNVHAWSLQMTLLNYLFTSLDIFFAVEYIVLLQIIAIG